MKVLRAMFGRFFRRQPATVAPARPEPWSIPPERLRQGFDLIYSAINPPSDAELAAAKSAHPKPRLQS